MFSSHSFIEGDVSKGVVRSMALSEFSVMIVMSFVHAAPGGVMYRESSDPRLYSNTGILIPLGAHVRKFIDGVGSLNILYSCDI